MIERAAAAKSLESTPLDIADAVNGALGILREQRSRLVAAPRSRWSEALEQVEEQERGIVRAAFAAASLARVQIPEAWPAHRAIPALADWIASRRSA